jgi:amylosucrase
MTHTMQKQFPLSPGTAWVNYLRSHDDIGWGFADEDAAEVGINGFDHRLFLNQFYTGRFPGSFARGLPFNYNPRTQDMRICGTMASLGGLEEAQALRDDRLMENAINRLLLMFGVTLVAGGIPLVYLGDEVGTTNYYDYTTDPGKADDSRWIHRPPASPELYAARNDAATPSGRLYQSLRKMIAVRKALPYLAGGETQFLYTGSDHVLGIVRHHSVLALANMSDHEQTVALEPLAPAWNAPEYIDNPLTGERHWSRGQITLPPYHQAWLVAVRA